MSIDLDAIRQRHEFDVRTADFSSMRVREHNTHDDRGALLAEVDRLTAELAESRAAYDAVCRSVGRRAVERTVTS